MNRQVLVPLLVFFCLVGQLQAQSPTIENVPPVVVKTTPEAGTAEVDALANKIRI